MALAVAASQYRNPQNHKMVESCTYCEGSGSILVSKRRECDKCGESGWIMEEKKCEKCGSRASWKRVISSSVYAISPDYYCGSHKPRKGLFVPYEPGERSCQICNGNGFVLVRQKDICSSCGGTGKGKLEEAKSYQVVSNNKSKANDSEAEFRLVNLKCSKCGKIKIKNMNLRKSLSLECDCGGQFHMVGSNDIDFDTNSEKFSKN